MQKIHPTHYKETAGHKYQVALGFPQIEIPAYCKHHHGNYDGTCFNQHMTWEVMRNAYAI